MATVKYITGLDLGQAHDYTALTILQKSKRPDSDHPERLVNHYAARHLERLPLGTPYTTVCTRMATIFAAPDLAGSGLAVDMTGVGRPVVDMLRRAKLKARIEPITVTGGHRASVDPKGGWLVPKKELVTTLQLLLQSRRLKIAPMLPDAQTLVKELLDFQVKITASAHETFGAWREGTHDDLAFALAIAAWDGEHLGRKQPIFV